MRIATWNINSVKARLPNVLEWLHEQKPDVLLLQEIKCETAAFPNFEFGHSLNRYLSTDLRAWIEVA